MKNQVERYIAETQDRVDKEFLGYNTNFKVDDLPHMNLLDLINIEQVLDFELDIAQQDNSMLRMRQTIIKKKLIRDELRFKLMMENPKELASTFEKQCELISEEDITELEELKFVLKGFKGGYIDLVEDKYINLLIRMYMELTDF